MSDAAAVRPPLEQSDFDTTPEQRTAGTRSPKGRQRNEESRLALDTGGGIPYNLRPDFTSPDCAPDCVCTCE